MSTRLVVTTSILAKAALRARAQAVARCCGAPFVEREGSFEQVLRDADSSLAYVVGGDREELRSRHECLFIHPRTYYLVARSGLSAPLLRAIWPGEGPRPTRVVDGTIGLCVNALQIASLLGCHVVGLEASGPIACLAESGIGRLGVGDRPWSAGARRIRVLHTEAREWMDQQPPGSHDVVYLDPMFEHPQGAQPNFSLLRRLAHGAPASALLIASARRIAAHRVVLRVPPAAAALEVGPPPRRVRGKQVDYFVWDTAERSAD